MEQRRSLWTRFAGAADLDTEPCPNQPLVELSGTKRVLVENHQGICAYGQEEIQIKVSYGSLIIKGSELELTCMTKEQLIITGYIDAVLLFRGR